MISEFNTQVMNNLFYDYKVHYTGGNDDLAIGINVIAFFAFIYVDRFERQLERELSVFEN